MTEYVSVRDALIRDLESAEDALSGAKQSFEQADQAARQALGRANSASDGLARNRKNVEKLKRALAIIEGDDA